jgi:hypothetical protein
MKHTQNGEYHLSETKFTPARAAHFVGFVRKTGTFQSELSVRHNTNQTGWTEVTHPVNWIIKSGIASPANAPQ